MGLPGLWTDAERLGHSPALKVYILVLGSAHRYIGMTVTMRKIKLFGGIQCGKHFKTYYFCYCPEANIYRQKLILP